MLVPGFWLLRKQGSRLWDPTKGAAHPLRRGVEQPSRRGGAGGRAAKQRDDHGRAGGQGTRAGSLYRTNRGDDPRDPAGGRDNARAGKGSRGGLKDCDQTPAIAVVRSFPGCRPDIFQTVSERRVLGSASSKDPFTADEGECAATAASLLYAIAEKAAP